jgi:hypothetical protein
MGVTMVERMPLRHFSRKYREVRTAHPPQELVCGLDWVVGPPVRHLISQPTAQSPCLISATTTGELNLLPYSYF